MTYMMMRPLFLSADEMLVELKSTMVPQVIVEEASALGVVQTLFLFVRVLFNEDFVDIRMLEQRLL
jgi:hypothetical protein